MAEIRLTGLAKRFAGDAFAVHPTDLTVRDGEFLTLLGPSGCGKTTTLRMLAGLEDPTAGTIHFGDTRVDRLAAGRRNIAMVFQNYALYPHLSVRGNLEYPLKKRGVAREERTARVERTAGILHISELLDRRPRQLSGGQQQRVALGRAMIREPEVFLFDEPLSNLDAQLRTVMRTELIRLHTAVGRTMIYVTHDQLEAMTMSDRIVVMLKGRIQQVGPPHEVYARPANRFVASFVGTPAMNLMDGSIREENGASVFATDDGAVRLPLPGVEAGTRAAIGVRPEHVRLGDGVIAATVDTVEDLGHEMQFLLRVGNTELRARAPSETRLKVGEPVPISFAPGAVHVFGEDGACLKHGAL